MKKKSISNILVLKKSVVAELSDKNQQAIVGGSTVSTSVIRALCGTINPLNCSMSAFCAY
ncbi:class I lanthipeptide [uncultured Kordia sp.]|uniref:class I lanthipeptide n=1 Tax=uncultured Kordia sp. TaxID=507699 RepID=UPI00261A2BF0|nr:class I lanthipeptide [uncultured Kordia sp.]